MKGRKSETAYLVECDRELQAGTDNQSGCPGDTNFSVHTPPPPPIPSSAPSKSFQSRQGGDGCLLFCLAVRYSMSHPRWLDKTWAGQTQTGLTLNCCTKCTFGWAHCCLVWVGQRWGWIPGGVLFNVSAVGQSGDMVSGAWEWPAWEGFISTPLSCQSQPKNFHSSLTYVRFLAQKAPKFRRLILTSSRHHIFAVVNNTAPSVVVSFYRAVLYEKL